MQHANWQHLIVILIIAFFILTLFGWRVRRLNQRAFFNIGIKRMLIISLLFGYAGIVRAIHHPHAMPTLLAAWFLPLIMIGIPSYKHGLKKTVGFDPSTKHYAIPSTFYRTLIILLLPYVLICTALLVSHPLWVNNLVYLTTTSIIKGGIYGYFLGCLLGMTRHAKSNSTH